MDRNDVAVDFLSQRVVSLSARRAWIEIQCLTLIVLPLPVALRKESVDRNIGLGAGCLQAAKVALRKESVDRNLGFGILCVVFARSLSARRAWIEI